MSILSIRRPSASTLLVAVCILAALALPAEPLPAALGSVFADEGALLPEKALEAAMATAFRRAEMTYGNSRGFRTAKKATGKALSFGVVETSDPTMVALKATDPSGREESRILFFSTAAQLDVLLSPAVFALWAKASGLADDWPEAPPVPTLETGIQLVKPLLGVDRATTQYLAALAPAPSGGVFVAGTGYVAEFDAKLDLRSSLRPDADDPYSYVYQLASTPSGTVAALGANGTLYRLPRGSGKFAKWGNIQPLPLSMAFSRDDALVYQDMGTMRFVWTDGRKRTAMTVGRSGTPMLSPFAYDGDGLLWAYDYASSMVMAYDGDGALVHALAICAGPGAEAAPQRIYLRRGGFLLAGQRSVAAYDRDGLPLWQLDSPYSPSDPRKASTIPSLAVSGDGAVYALLSGTLSIVRLDDDQSIREAGTLYGAEFARNLAAVRDASIRVWREPDDPSAASLRARLVEACGAGLAAFTARVAIEEAFPEDAANAGIAAAARLEMDRSFVMALVASVYDPLGRYGAETARVDYQKALRECERYLARASGDAGVVSARDALVSAFRAREAGTTAPARDPLRIRASIDPLFPAFLGRYEKIPVGYAELFNDGVSAMRSATIRVSMRDFMDYPSEIPWKGLLAPGQSVRVDLKLVLNRSVLDLQEDVNVQARVEVLWEGDGAAGSGVAFAPVVIRRKTALSWNDSAALAAFVTPNDGVVSEFAHAALASGTLPMSCRAAMRGAAVVEALGALGFRYVEDPAAPFSGPATGQGAIDTVRFPRVTLSYASGDCDDTTALFLSCLESLGVETAIVTTPGHVLAAFRTGEPASLAPRYEAGGRGAIARDGALWIPVETTAFARGFAAAWKEGYEAWKKAAGEGKAVIIPVSEAREGYPALPLSATPSRAPVPDPLRLAAMAGTDLKALRAAFVEPALAAADGAVGSARARNLNEAAIGLAWLGRYGEAASVLARAIEADGRLVAPRINLYNALVLSGDGKGASESIMRAGKALPEAPEVRKLVERASGNAANVPPAGSGGDGTRGADGAAFVPEWAY